MGAASIWLDFLHRFGFVQQYVNEGDSADPAFANSPCEMKTGVSRVTSLCRMRLSLAFRNSCSHILARSVSRKLSSLQE